MYSKFGVDRLWNEKALADRKSDNNNNIKNKNNVGGACGPYILAIIPNPSTTRGVQ